MDWWHGYIWTVRDGKGVRFCWFNKPEEALEAAGLRDETTCGTALRGGGV